MSSERPSARVIVHPLLVFAASVLATVLTPSTDVLTLLLIWVPLAALFCGLFELGYRLTGRAGGRRPGE